MCFANFSAELTYCQGMDYVALFLLRHLQDECTEEQVFWLFTSIMKKHQRLYLPGTKKKQQQQ